MSSHLVTATSIILGLASIILGIWTVKNFSGKLRISVIFLIIAAFLIFALKSTEGFISGNIIANADLVKDIGNVGVVLFIFLSILTMKLMADSIAKE